MMKYHKYKMNKIIQGKKEEKNNKKKNNKKCMKWKRFQIER